MYAVGRVVYAGSGTGWGTRGNGCGEGRAYGGRCPWYGSGCLVSTDSSLYLTVVTTGPTVLTVVTTGPTVPHCVTVLAHCTPLCYCTGPLYPPVVTTVVQGVPTVVTTVVQGVPTGYIPGDTLLATTPGLNPWRLPWIAELWS